MQIPLVMTVIGKDRTGLVESIARVVAEHGGNWLESRMCRLGGEFAGLLRVHIPAERRTDLEHALSKLDDLTVVVHSDESAAPTGKHQLAALEVVGQDRPGIVREVTRALAAQGVNVEELATECVSAPMSGEPLFQARARLLLPDGLTVSALRQSLEEAVSGLTVEVTLAEWK
jgi:glycine cleavage system regulatory protein